MGRGGRGRGWEGGQRERDRRADGGTEAPGGGGASGAVAASASKATRVGPGPGSRPESQARTPVQAQPALVLEPGRQGVWGPAAAAAALAAAAPAAAAPAPDATATAPKSGVDMLSDEITGLKATLGPLIVRLRASTVPGDGGAANALSGHIGRLDDALMACQKERSKLMMAVSGSAPAATPAAAPAAATPVAPPPVKRTDVIFVGGLVAGDYTLSSDMYSPGDAAGWRPGPQLSKRRAYCGAAALGRYVYIMGGGSGPNTWHDTTLRLDLATGESVTVAPLAAARGSLGCVALGGRVYAIGGDRTGEYEASTEVYDPVRDAWSAGPTLGTPRFTTAAAALDGAIYAVGGFGGKGYLSSVERLDPREGRWVGVASMAAARGALAVAPAHGGLFAMGGFDGTTINDGAPPQERGFIASCERYDPRVGWWVAAAAMAKSRAYGAAFCLEGRLYAMAGMTGQAANAGMEVYDAARDRWVKAPVAAPPPRSMGAAVVATWE